MAAQFQCFQYIQTLCEHDSSLKNLFNHKWFFGNNPNMILDSNEVKYHEEEHKLCLEGIDYMVKCYKYFSAELKIGTTLVHKFYAEQDSETQECVINFMIDNNIIEPEDEPEENSIRQSIENFVQKEKIFPIVCLFFTGNVFFGNKETMKNTIVKCKYIPEDIKEILIELLLKDDEKIPDDMEE